jgi:toxin CptA
MSIAVSAVITPSPGVRVVQALFGAANLAAGAAIASGWAGPLFAPRLIAGAALLAALLLHAPLRFRSKLRRIDISGLGQIRLTVQQTIDAPPGSGALVNLLAGSTLWPGMLVLRLGSDASVCTLLVLGDSVQGGQFRAVALAMADIASRNKIFSGNNKIL